MVLNPEQTCSVPERTIFQNLFLARDIINYCNQKNINGYILTIDQEKAFDRVDRKFLLSVMEKMNFGQNVMSWIKTIYNGTQSSTQINGHESVRFPLTRGAWQGCPLSAILYSLLAETLGEEIRNSKKLFGIVLPGNHEIKNNAICGRHYDLSFRTNTIKTSFRNIKTFRTGHGFKSK